MDYNYVIFMINMNEFKTKLAKINNDSYKKILKVVKRFYKYCRFYE